MEAEIARRRNEGWDIINRTSDSVHFRRRRREFTLQTCFLLAMSALLLFIAARERYGPAFSTCLMMIAVFTGLFALLRYVQGEEELDLVTLNELEKESSNISNNR